MKKKKFFYAIIMVFLLITKISFSYAMERKNNELEVYGSKAIYSLQKREKEPSKSSLYNNRYEDIELKKRRRYDSNGDVVEEEWTARNIIKNSHFCSYQSIVLCSVAIGTLFILYHYITFNDQILSNNAYQK